jgi:hypothetical protein
MKLVKSINPIVPDYAKALAIAIATSVTVRVIQARIKRIAQNNPCNPFNPCHP